MCIDDLLKNKKLILKLICRFSYALKYPDDSFKKDKEFVKIAVNNESKLYNILMIVLKKIKILFIIILKI